MLCCFPTNRENVPGVMLFQEEGNPKKPRLAVTYNGNVIVLNVKSGEELWKESLPNRFGFISSRILKSRGVCVNDVKNA